jgi:hypothetical protein
VSSESESGSRPGAGLVLSVGAPDYERTSPELSELRVRVRARALEPGSLAVSGTDARPVAGIAAKGGLCTQSLLGRAQESGALQEP